MKIVDRIAMNRLIKIITDFILSIVKIFKPSDDPSIEPKRRRPLKDLLDRWRK